MPLVEGIHMLDLSAVVLGKRAVIHPTVLWDEQDTILVDAGYPGQVSLFREAMAQAGVAFDKLTKIIITHQDVDHIGSLPAIIKEASLKLEVSASELERAFIQGERRLLKLTDAAIDRAVNSLPADMPEAYRQAVRGFLLNPPSANVDRTLGDGEVLPYCGGLVVINTPGHTPGHISLYHQASKTLIAGDALTVVDTHLRGPDPHATLDMGMAIDSLHRLAEYDIKAVICYHGGLYAGDDVNQRIATLAGGTLN